MLDGQRIESRCFPPDPPTSGKRRGAGNWVTETFELYSRENTPTHQEGDAPQLHIRGHGLGAFSDFTAHTSSTGCSLTSFIINQTTEVGFPESCEPLQHVNQTRGGGCGNLQSIVVFRSTGDNMDLRLASGVGGGEWAD